MAQFRKLNHDEPGSRKLLSGQGMTEFLVVVLLLSILVIASVRIFGKSARCMFQDTMGMMDEVSEEIEGCSIPQHEEIEFTPPPPPPPKPPPPPQPSRAPTIARTASALPPTPSPCPPRGGVCGYVTSNWACIPQYTASCRMPASAEPPDCLRCCSGVRSDGTQTFGFNCGKSAGSACTCY